MKNILVFVNSFDIGGVTTLLKDIYRNLDTTQYRMSFVRLNWNKNDFDNEVFQNGDQVFYYENQPLGKWPVINYAMRRKTMIHRVCNAVRKDVAYDIAYIHSNAAYCVPAAKKMGIKKIIMHVHEAVSDFLGNENKSFLTQWLWNKRVKMYNRLSDYKLGDSALACVAKFGENVLNDPKMRVIHPPINLDKFNPHNYDANDTICQFKVDPEKFNMIHVGRLCDIKNQEFLLDLLEEMVKKKDCCLYIVGDGETQKKKLIAKAKKKDILQFIKFYPGNINVPLLMKGMNCFLLPSFSEAFGMVAVESQLMEVPCFLSSNVPKDVDIGMATFIDLNSGAKYWCDRILDYKFGTYKTDQNRVCKFDISFILKDLYNIFE